MNKTKPFNIPKKLIYKAYTLVKANGSSYGIDQQTIAEFDKNWQRNLYKLWNRMSSGSYFPSPVRVVEIPKKCGGKRLLGISTITDRIAQTAIRLVLEPVLECKFHDNSFGYRPERSALDAVAITRKRCRTYNYVIEFDIKGLFDNIPWDLLMKSVEHNTNERWIILYIERSLKVSMQNSDGKVTERFSGTSQGGPLSPLLANLFMHYAFDLWLSKEYPDNEWCRYADDGIIHCRTEEEAKLILEKMECRLKNCGLELHTDKTKIVYCRDRKRLAKHENYHFDFLGYTFRPRLTLNRKNGSLFLDFSPAVSKKALNAMRSTIRTSNIRNKSNLNLEEIAKELNPILRGWINYYGKHHKEALEPLVRHVNLTLIKWAKKKYGKMQRYKTKASRFIQKIMEAKPKLFEHWKHGIAQSFA